MKTSLHPQVRGEIKRRVLKSGQRLPDIGSRKNAGGEAQGETKTVKRKRALKMSYPWDYRKPSN